MLFDCLYKSESVGDLGTLYQLKTRMNRKDVSDKVNKSYHGCEAFFNTVDDGYIVYAATEFFGMESPNSSPTLNKLEPSNNGAVSQKQLYDAVEKLVEKYVLLEAQPTAVLFCDIQQSEQPQIFLCRYPDCNKQYQHEKRGTTMKSRSMDCISQTTIKMVGALQILAVKTGFLITLIISLRQVSFTKISKMQLKRVMEQELNTYGNL